jgi:hypothetical protein
MKLNPNPTTVASVAESILRQLDDVNADPGLKIAALRTAADAITNAVSSQTVAALVAQTLNVKT